MNELYNFYLKSCNKNISVLRLFCTRIQFTIKKKKMNTTELKGNWNEQKAKLKQKFAVLTDNDLMFEEGKKEEMFAKLQIKLGKTKEELHKILSDR